MANEQELKKSFSQLFEDNPKIGNVLDKIEKGTCTYDDAYVFSREVGDITVKVFGQIENVDNDVLILVQDLMEKNLDLVGGVCEEAQVLMNEAAGVGIKPVSPNKLRQQDKVNGILESARNPVGASDPIVNLQRGTKTMTMAYVDDWVRANADFQSRAGMSPYIVREWDGTWGSHDTKHTDWCSRLSGTYKYDKGTINKDVFKRHEGCQCKVTYYANKRAEGVLAALAKGQKDASGMLRKSPIPRSKFNASEVLKDFTI